MSLLEESAYANINAAIQVMQGTEKVLSEKVAHVEQQRKGHQDFVLGLIEKQQQECTAALNNVKKGLTVSRRGSWNSPTCFA